MSGPRAQFGRRAAVEPTAVHATAVEAVPAGRAQARRSVAVSGGFRRRMAVPALAVAVGALTWVDAGVLRAEDAPSRSAQSEPRARDAQDDDALVGGNPAPLDAVKAPAPDDPEPDIGEREKED